MDLRNMPTVHRDKIRRCDCGCDSFRFKVVIEDENFHTNLCRNCNHALAAHINLPGPEQ